jgi:hypothetical protein
MEAARVYPQVLSVSSIVPNDGPVAAFVLGRAARRPSFTPDQAAAAIDVALDLARQAVDENRRLKVALAREHGRCAACLRTHAVQDGGAPLRPTSPGPAGEAGPTCVNCGVPVDRPGVVCDDCDFSVRR